ncbi:PREDICTED: probable vacuolar amino acid transporter YPQ1 isoform X2 [Nelumbo nucifera]|uniref:Vacuolar amino acid transporter YPQ1 n=2 Tax=Nelumbo nucifera TaxID=4432 RepID=A0A822ZIB5_NELNU|nr:PREDICTED: probable vacuolar amino acid transporter YPQ1 isoform X2 [Nelumbo nucifera]DAD43215.1 TPA_asm: hypothetical protein HUJ06_001445 [Nelumbo nucifera]
MGLFKGSYPVCPRNLHCSEWARTYMKYCLCSAKDGASLTLGLISVISWGVAEVPQIITNYKKKSTESLSIAFLITWIIGDLFNLFGCLLEPATLPTQYYMAMLYTLTTLILALQTIYYSRIYHLLKSHRHGHKSPILPEIDAVDKEHYTNNFGKKQSALGDRGVLPSSPIPVSVPSHSRDGSCGRELYYMSARSLSRSHTPTAGSHLACPCGYEGTNSISDHDCRSIEEPLLSRVGSMQSTPPMNTKNMLCVVSALTFFLSTFRLQLSANSRFSMYLENQPGGHVIRIGRRLLQKSSGPLLENHGEGSSSVGTFLGWAMAAIYMGGRLPQIWLNIRRGHVGGLNPLMFVFALVGNATYVASILVSSLNLSKIRPNLPWLVDAGGCILLDCFIIIQFIHFRYRKPKGPIDKHNDISFTY